MSSKGEIVIRSGQTLHLMELRQYGTYNGLIEGLPTAERNKRQLERLIAEHRDKPYVGGPFLIRPTERPIENLGEIPYPLGTPSALPSVTCIGRFESVFPARDKSKDYSGLVVIWFQEDFAFPIDPVVAEQIFNIDWDTHAADLEH